MDEPTQSPSSWRRLAPVVMALLLAVAGARAGEPDLARQRADFQAAEIALKRGDEARYRQLLAGLRDYPLYAYLLFQDLRRRLATAPAREVRGFLEAHAETPLAPRLRRAWLTELYRQGRWADLVADYRPARDAAMRCRYLLSRYRLGQRQPALAEVAGLWRVGHSQPRACDPLFDRWREAGGLTPALAWERIGLAMRAGQVGLARYLRRYLPESQRPLVDLWQRVRLDPSAVTRVSAGQGPATRLREIQAYALKRWARRDPQAAARAWDRLRRRIGLDQGQAAQVERAVALGLARAEDPGALARLAALPAPSTDRRVRETAALLALKRGEWGRALEWIQGLGPIEGRSERWRYWEARALEGLGRRESATELYTGLAGERSYYGFLAADRRDRPYRLNHVPLAVAPERSARLLRLPAVRRARELLALGRRLDARREWYHLTQRLDAPDLRAAASLAHDWGWHDRTILTLGRSGEYDDIVLRFPLAHSRPIFSQARSLSLDPAWLFAVLRQESAFAEDARSPKGARGLMQLMPATARQVARRLKTRLGRLDRLYDAPTNIRLGSSYLRQLMDQLDGHPVLATAAYNAGPRRIRAWLPEADSMPADLWIEAVPFRETRRYVRKVLTYTTIYQERLGRPLERLSQRLRPIPTRTGLAASATGDGTRRSG